MYDLLSDFETSADTFEKYVSSLFTEEMELTDWLLNVSFKKPFMPSNPMMGVVSGAGLTHRRAIRSRGLSWKDALAIQPEWFYKGNGCILKTNDDDLIVPSFAGNGVEEIEIVALYYITRDKMPMRVGWTLGNEFYDRLSRKKHPNYLAQAKLMNCSVSAFVHLGEIPSSVTADVSIINNDRQVVWSRKLSTGLDSIIYPLEELEDLLFRHDQFCQPGMLHYLYLGSDVASFMDNKQLTDGDQIEVVSRWLPIPFINSIRLENKVYA